MKKRMLSIMLVICMMLMLVPTTVFAKSDILLGDIDCDGNVTARDLLLLKQYLCDISGVEISDSGLKNSDVNRDGNINVFDYTLLYNRILELIELNGEEAGTPQTNIPPKTISSSACSDDSIRVNATSNYFPLASTIVDKDGEYVTVTYFIDSDMDIIDLQWSLIYDPDFLEFDESDNKKDDVTINLMPLIDNSFYWNIVNGENENKIKAIACTAIKEESYDFAGKGLVPFVTATFKIIGSGETEVHLYVECLTLSNSENKAVNSGAVNAETSHPARMTAVYKGNYDITDDITKPAISNLENNKTYCDAIEFEVTDNVGVASVQAGDEILTPGTNGKYTLEKGKGNVKVVATDFAGNTADVTVTVNNGHTYSEWRSNGYGSHTRKCTINGCNGSDTGNCAGGKATCTELAICDTCKQPYGEIDTSNHSLENIPAKDATVTETGNIEYYHCKDCGKYFADENGTKEINLADTVIAVNAWAKTVLRLQATASKTSIKLKWNAVPDADGYVVYWNKCGAKNGFKQVKVIENGKTLTWTHKTLKKNTWNKYYVKAYKVIDGKKFFIKTSSRIHLVTKGGKYTNVKKLKSSISKITLKKGKTKTLKITQVYAEKNKNIVKHMRPLTYTTLDKTVATVTSKGVIKAKGIGSCYIYITAHSGVYTRVKVTVK